MLQTKTMPMRVIAVFDGRDSSHLECGMEQEGRRVNFTASDQSMTHKIVLINGSPLEEYYVSIESISNLNSKACSPSRRTIVNDICISGNNCKELLNMGIDASSMKALYQKVAGLSALELSKRIITGDEPEESKYHVLVPQLLFLADKISNNTIPEHNRPFLGLRTEEAEVGIVNELDDLESGYLVD